MSIVSADPETNLDLMEKEIGDVKESGLSEDKDSSIKEELPSTNIP